MKKLIITSALLFGSTLIFAQKSNPAKTQIVSNEDPHNPLVNGIPYNQYKIQVQQEMQKKAEAQAQEKAKQKIELEKFSKLKMPETPNEKQEQISNQKIEAKSNDSK